MKKLSILSLLVLILGCSKFNPALLNYNPTPLNALSQFTISINNTQTIRADGKSIIPIVLNKGTDSLDDSIKVYFQCNYGSFLNSPVFFLQKQATAYLKIREDTGLYSLTTLIEAGTQVIVEKDTSFYVQAAYPDSIAFEVNNTISSTTSPTTIYPFLLRQYGFVTKGQKINLLAYQIDSSNNVHSVGRFQNITNNFSDSLGALSPILFFSDTGDIDTTRNVVVRGSALNDEGEPVIDSTIVRYK